MIENVTGRKRKMSNSLPPSMSEVGLGLLANHLPLAVGMREAIKNPLASPNSLKGVTHDVIKCLWGWGKVA